MERIPGGSGDSSLDPRRRTRGASEDAKGDKIRTRIEIEYSVEKEKIKKKDIIWSSFDANIKEILDITNRFAVPRDDLEKVNNLLKFVYKLLPISEANVDQLAKYERQSEQWRNEFREKYPVLASQASERTEDSVPHPSYEREHSVEKEEEIKRKHIIWSSFNEI